MPVLKDLTGLQFDRLTVIQLLESRNQKRQWFCRCVCGRTTIVATSCLMSGNTRSCGCLIRESIENISIIHGMARRTAKTIEYKTWVQIRARCYNKRNPGFKNYGGRGIVMSYDWYVSFECFLFDMGLRPSPAHSIERLDNDGPYAKWNCVWATRKQQGRNTRRARRLIYNNKSLTLTELAEQCGIERTALAWRLRHWPMEKALSTPTRQHKLNEEDVLEIRKLKKQGVSFRSLAIKFNLTRAHVVHICGMKHWKNT